LAIPDYLKMGKAGEKPSAPQQIGLKDRIPLTVNPKAAKKSAIKAMGGTLLTPS
jgi:hypothetical protein